MKVFENISLKTYNTFGVEAKAKELILLEKEDELPELHRLIKNKKYYLIGGGSNILLRGDYDGTIVVNDITGIRVLKSDSSGHYIEVKAGEEWNSFVEFTVLNNFYGLENLAYIPGKCGAAPVQNIGAYGVEQNLYFAGLRGFDLNTGKYITFKNEECMFGYRNSIFKNQLKGKILISSIIYKLDYDFKPNIKYADLNNYFADKNPSQKDVFDAVISIRKSKLPEPAELGNAGSFFKNPIIPASLYGKITKANPCIKGHKLDKDYYKLSAAQLIEQAGWKGKSLPGSDAAVFGNHSLILINKGSASGEELFKLSALIIKDVNNKFSIILEREVNII